MEKEPMSAEAENLIKKIEEDKSKKILEILNYAIESKSKIELTVSNPPTHTFSTVIVSPEKIENGYLQVKTIHNTKISIDLSRVRRVVVLP